MKTGLPFSILIVEDDEDDRMFIDEAFLKIGWGAEVKKFRDGFGLFHYLESIEASLYPRLFVLDANLPGISADEIISILKRNPSYASIPIAVYSNYLSPSKKEELKRTGVHCCMGKGSTMENLIELAKELKELAEQKSKDGFLA